jgi:hypothetical protein
MGHSGLPRPGRARRKKHEGGNQQCHIQATTELQASDQPPAMRPDPTEAQAMIDALASVGAGWLDITVLDDADDRRVR